MADTTISRLVIDIERTRSSVNGNPAFFITFDDGQRMRTQSDTSWAYAVDPSMVGKMFLFTVTRAGRISYGREI